MPERPTKVVWWHFSDVHWKAGPSEERTRYLDTFFEHLERKTLEAHGVPHFIAITGDLSYSGKTAEYEAFRLHFIDRLTALLRRSDSSEPPIFIVPGNHDVDRDATRRIHPELVKGITTVSQLDELFQNDDDVETLLRPFRAFSNFQATLNKPPIDPKPALSWGAQSK